MTILSGLNGDLIGVSSMTCINDPWCVKPSLRALLRTLQDRPAHQSTRRLDLTISFGFHDPNYPAAFFV
jgi:hypothetical protein